MHLKPLSSQSTDKPFEPTISWHSFLLVYSIPIILFLTIACIIKYRPIREFPSLRSWLSWYCTCSPKQVLDELEQPDRIQMIMAIDAQSLASSICETPLLDRRDLSDNQETAIP